MASMSVSHAKQVYDSLIRDGLLSEQEIDALNVLINYPKLSPTERLEAECTCSECAYYVRSERLGHRHCGLLKCKTEESFYCECATLLGETDPIKNCDTCKHFSPMFNGTCLKRQIQINSLYSGCKQWRKADDSKDEPC